MEKNDNSKIKIKLPFILVFAALIIIVAGIMSAVSIVNPILMSLFISIICAQPIAWLQSKKVPNPVAVFIVVIGIAIVFIGLSDVIGLSLASFSQNVDLYEKNLSEMGTSILEYINGIGINISVTKLSNMFNVSKVMNVTAGVLGQLGAVMGNALTIFFLALFLLLELDDLKIKTKVILKDSTKSHAYIGRIAQNIRHYLSIKTMTSLLTGFLIFVCLKIVGVDYAIIWALIAFLLNYIPNIGSFIAAIPAVLFAVIQLGFPGLIWTAIIFVTVNVIVGSVIEPKVMGKGLGLSTYVVFVSLLVWGFILGTVGMFLSVPLTMAIKIMLEQNESTKWIAILLGTQNEAQEALDNSES